MSADRSPAPRPGDASHLDVDALGVVVRIDLSGLPPVDRDVIAEAWSGAGRHETLAPVATVSPRSHLHFEETVADLSTQVTLAALSARRGDLWMVHAGAVADEAGRVILFSGRSGMGKTTLMTRLAREYAYVTDESVGVAADGSVLPYRKPLSVIDDANRAKRQASPRGLGLRNLPDAPLRLHAVVVLDRDQRHVSACLEALDIADAVSAIAPQCSYLAELDEPLRTMIGHIEHTGGALRLLYREAEDAAALVPGLFDLVRPPRPTASPARPDPHLSPDPSGYRRTAVADAVTLDGGLLALLLRGADDETTIHLLDGIGPVLWHAAAGVRFEELMATAVRAHGEPTSGSARDAVDAALRALRTAGILRGPED